MNAVIIYEEFDNAAGARALLERAACRADETMRWNVGLWRLDVLKLKLADGAAEVEAMAAHLIVLAGNYVRPALTWLLDWLERWAISRQIQAAALVMWDIGANRRTEAVAPELAQFARRHGLSLIACEPALVKPEYDVYPHWGLND